MRDVGKNIRQIRLDKGMTQDDLAERIHTTRQTVSNYETGRSRPDIDTFILLAQALECDTEVLLYGKARPAMDPAEQKRLLQGGGTTILLFTLGQLIYAAGSVIMADRYQLPSLAVYSVLLCSYLWPVALGWTIVQAAISLRRFRLRCPQCPQWLHWLLLAVVLLYIGSFFLPVTPFIRFRRLLLQYHLFPTALPGKLVLVLMGAAVRFTKQT